jgi:shikimate dehydrogenase
VTIDGHTRVSGIIGWPVEHSLSPVMHNAAFAELGLNWLYAAFPVPPDRVAEAVRGLAAAGVAGINVTIPHKQAVLECCSSVSDAAAAIGAANTLVPDGRGGFRADNTDAAGFLRAMDAATGADLGGARALVIGAGGAARAVAWALRSRGARLLVSNRTDEKAAALGPTVPFGRGPLDDACRDVDLVVNCTSLGLEGSSVPDELPLEGIRPDQIVADIVYRPGGTAWLSAAARRGARTVDGLGMLLHQGADAFEQWTGRDAPVAVMERALTGATRHTVSG